MDAQELLELCKHTLERLSSEGPGQRFSANECDVTLQERLRSSPYGPMMQYRFRLALHGYEPTVSAWATLQTLAAWSLYVITVARFEHAPKPGDWVVAVSGKRVFAAMVVRKNRDHVSGFDLAMVDGATILAESTYTVAQWLASGRALPWSTESQ